jgi:ABC-type multidrug transport system ATPase subunit
MEGRRREVRAQADLTARRSALASSRVKPSLLSVERVSRRFGDREVVRSVDVTLDAGERLALMGPNGSGKTTLLRCVAGTLSPTTGRVLIAGHPAGTVAARRLVGASLSQERSFYQRLSGYANLMFFARIRRVDGKAEAAVDALVEELELREIAAERVDRCSTGMIQQLALARALVGDPEVVLLDEPTRSLDDSAVQRLWAALDRRPRLTLVIATHSDADVSKCHGSLVLPH